MLEENKESDPENNDDDKEVNERNSNDDKQVSEENHEEIEEVFEDKINIVYAKNRKITISWNIQVAVITSTMKTTTI